MICLKVSPTSETYREETETKLVGLCETQSLMSDCGAHNDLSLCEPHQWDIQRRNI